MITNNLADSVDMISFTDSLNDVGCGHPVRVSRAQYENAKLAKFCVSLYSVY